LSWSARVSHGLQTYVLRWHQDRLQDVEPMVRQAVDDYPTYPVWKCVLAHLEAHLGQPPDAFEALAADDFGSIPVDEERLVSLSLLADAARIRGDAERAAVLYEHLAPYPERVALAYPEISLGSVSRYLGLLAETTGDPDAAIRHYEHAIEVNTRTDAACWLAATHDDLARVRAPSRGTPASARDAG
jgi:hypothetical protein